MLLNKLIYALPSSFHRFIYAGIKHYFRKSRNVTFRGLTLKLEPTVFHPTLYLTTETLLDYLLTLDLDGKSTLELGCGSGAISLYLARHRQVDGHVSDINLTAVNGVLQNAKRLSINITAYHSDLFESIPERHFDILIINPPFFANAINQVDEYAFNAGPEYQYFINLATQLKRRHNLISQVYLILTDKCDLDTILSFFTKESMEVQLISQKIVNQETHLIYSLNF